MKRLLTIILIFTLCFTAAVPALAAEVNADMIPLDSADITIEEGKTYSISSKEELFNFRDIVNSGSTFKGSCVQLLADIAVNEGSITCGGKNEEYNPYLDNQLITSTSDIIWWIPIGRHSGQTTAVFSGTFEGNNHTISGLIYDYSSGGGMAVFERCDGAVIRNLKVENFYFRAHNCAGICAKAWGGTIIENCFAAGFIPNRGLSGGIVGYVSPAYVQSGFACQIINCISACTIFEGSYHSSGISTSHNTGGIVGLCDNTEVIGCVNHGKISGTENIGAIIGSSGENVTMTDCENHGTAAGPDYINRLIGNQPDTGQHIHVYDTSKYAYDETAHFHACSCGDAINRAVHSFTYRTLREPSKTQDGIQRKTCLVCKAYFDEILKKEPSYTLEIENRDLMDYVDLWNSSTFHIAAKEGAHIKDVILNGVSLGPVTKVSFQDGDIIKIIFASNSQPEETPKQDKELSAAEKNRLIKGIQATTIKASSVNVHNGSIRITWKKSPGYKVDYYQIYRSTKKNSGYGKKAFYTTKTGKATTYTNSKSLKVGTRYYYKFRGVRVIDGKKYYTQYSNKANRRAQAPIVRANPPY